MKSLKNKERRLMGLIISIVLILVIVIVVTFIKISNLKRDIKDSKEAENETSKVWHPINK
jgi:hypothetical protein